MTARAAATNASFTYAPSSPETGKASRFDASASTCDDDPCTYRWQTTAPTGPAGHSGRSAPGETLRFTFRNVGTKRVRLTVTDDDGVSDSTMRTVAVAAPGRSRPVAEPVAEPDAEPVAEPAAAPAPAAATGGFPTPVDDRCAGRMEPRHHPQLDADREHGRHRGAGRAGSPTARTSSSTRANVTVRRVHLQGGWIDAEGGGTVIEDSTIDPPQQGSGQEGVVSYCGYTARRVKIWNRIEGFRAGGSCGPVTIEDSFVRIVPPSPCGDWHGDGLQGYGAPAITVRNLTIDFNETGCGGTAPFFVPDSQGNTSANVNRLLVKGGGYSFRLGRSGQRLRPQDRQRRLGLRPDRGPLLAAERLGGEHRQHRLELPGHEHGAVAAVQHQQS